MIVPFKWKGKGEWRKHFPGKEMMLRLLTFHWLKVVTWYCLDARVSEKCCFQLNIYFLGTTLQKKVYEFRLIVGHLCCKGQLYSYCFWQGQIIGLLVCFVSRGGRGRWRWSIWYNFSIFRSSINLCSYMFSPLS